MTKPSLSDYGTYDESTVPRLWDGVVGAWCPSLGPTGSRLHDLSRYGNWGTLTNMDAATDWIVDGGQYALDFDGTNDYVALPTIAVSGSVTISAWFNARSTLAAMIFNKQPTNTAFNLFIFSGSLSVRGGGLTSVSSSVSSNTNYHAVATIRGTTGTLYLNGSQAATGTVDAIGSTTGVCEIGRYGDFGAGYYFNGWIGDVGLWNRALTAAEASELYLLGRGGMFRRRRVRRGYVSEAVNRSYLFANRGQVIGGGTL